MTVEQTEVDLSLIPKGEQIEFYEWYLVHNDTITLKVAICGINKIFNQEQQDDEDQTGYVKPKNKAPLGKRKKEISMSDFPENYFDSITADMTNNPEEIFIKGEEKYFHDDPYYDYDPDQQMVTDIEAAKIRGELKKQNYRYSSQWEVVAENFDSINLKTSDNGRHWDFENRFRWKKQKNIAIRTGRKLKQQNLFGGKPSLQVSYLLGL
ncbi:MAG: hypothetical protein AAB657_03795 [Patescibacteria group bacterium]